MSKQIKPGKEVKPLLDQARAADLNVDHRKGTWIITAPEGGHPPIFIGNNVAAPHSLNNYKAAIRRMAQATEPADEQPANTWGMPNRWTIADLLTYASGQGIDVQAVPGGLRIVAASNGHAQAVAEVLRLNETSILRHLENPDMHNPAEVVELPSDMFVDDAYTVWACLRDEARAQGDKPAILNRISGVLWAGARDNTIATLSPEWSPAYRITLARFLADCGAMGAIRRGRAPLWWLSIEWPAERAQEIRQSGLPVAVLVETDPEPEIEIEPVIERPASDLDPIAALTRIKARIEQAEETAAAESERADEWQRRAGAESERANNAEIRAEDAEARADKAETRVSELEAENDDLRDQLDQVQPKLAELTQIKTLFRDLTGGSH
ncbi:hypothetical protein ITP53_11455 [Nonomuraea sp. K274]|uniref:Uncharacterized protein n=1 Tax=Nonomuraea cypriaca TaxID=1187855 RepID=A0A931AAG7_9ACTN|nr:hypothetical protein [Nonomuraea cypriaca]MBF8186355.1 hypothetical protein [Nonomuraea cypriaca]